MSLLSTSKRIRNKQEALLKHLNHSDNTEFKEGFLNAAGIDQYFGVVQGSKPGQTLVGGTRRFYKLCYNDIDNLLLLCHACNLCKSSKESLDWFGKQEPFLGQAFVQAVIDAGGLYDGIIVQKVLNRSSNSYDMVQIGDTMCVLHQGEAQGLGQFINEWFDEERPEYRTRMIRAYKNIWLAYKEIAEKQLHVPSLSASAGHAGRVSDKISLALQECIKVIEVHYNMPYKIPSKTGGTNDSPGSPSGSDDSEDEQSRLEAIEAGIKKVFTQMHEFKAIAKAVAKRTTLTKREVYDYLEKGRLNTGDTSLGTGTPFSKLNEEQQTEALAEIKTQLRALSEHPKFPSFSPEQKAEVLRIIEAAKYTRSPAGIAAAYQAQLREKDSQLAAQASRMMELEQENLELGKKKAPKRKAEAIGAEKTEETDETASKPDKLLAQMDMEGETRPMLFTPKRGVTLAASSSLTVPGDSTQTMEPVSPHAEEQSSTAVGGSGAAMETERLGATEQGPTSTDPLISPLKKQKPSGH